MKFNIIITMLLAVSAMSTQGQKGKPDFDRSAFYAAMASGSLDSVNSELGIVGKSSSVGKDAYEGTLLMKKAGLVSGPGKKLNLFKSGHRKLEDSIGKDTTNVEFRFLRLMIQEHAPGILNYRSQIDEDSQSIRSNYKNLPQVVQRAVVDYTKKSKVLKPEFF